MFSKSQFITCRQVELEMSSQEEGMLVEKGDLMIQDERSLEKERFGVLDNAGREEEAPTRAP